MKKLFHFTLFFVSVILILNQNIVAQTTAYFQQEVAYNIQVKLDDNTHQLHGQWTLVYTNNSPDALSFIYIHLWPNAYSKPLTAFGQQKLKQHDTDFYFAEDEDRGFIDSLKFTLSNTALQIKETDDVDIIKVHLPNPLQTGETTTIETPFRVQLPRSFSRLGHVGESYQVTQWYPKPAVYDRDGWHPMPYLDNGEFYSEFGTFEIEITVPDNYWVAATGTLTSPEERERLNEKSTQYEPEEFSWDNPVVWEEPAFPRSSTSFKTLHYSAENVHDFAWFADKRFHVLKDTLQLNSGKVIDVWAFFTDREAHLWQEAISYLKRSTLYYSERVGEYPYPQVTAAQSTLSNGGGMEYPMITLIGEEWSLESLDNVITHEVGHNWFYGILGSNERSNAWMDEGLNSFYEKEYTSAFYEEVSFPLSPFLQARSKMDQVELDYHLLVRRGKDQAPMTSSEKLTINNYWWAAYDKPSEVLLHLQAWMGREQFDRTMQNYYQQWKFKHPYPNDFKQELEEGAGEKLPWIFPGAMATTTQQNHKIASVKTEENELEVTIKNNGEFATKIPVTAFYTNDTITQWLQVAPENTLTTSFEKENILQVQIDPAHQTLEVNRQNDTWRRGLWDRWSPPRLRFATGLPNESYSDIYVLPFPAYNKYDGLMLGMGITNRGILAQPFEWLAAPLYSTRTKKIVGGGAMRYHWWPQNSKLQKITLAVNYRQLHFSYYDPQDVGLLYQRFSPSLTIIKKNHPTAERTQSLKWRSIWLNKEQLSFSNEGNFGGLESRDSWLHRLTFKHKQTTVLNPYQLKVSLEHYSFKDGFDRNQDHLLLEMQGKGKWLYQMNKAINWRLYSGVFLNNSLSGSSFSSSNALSLFDRGADDYRFDNLKIGRTENTGSLSQQVGLRAGGFKTPVSPAFTNLGQSNNWLVSLNLSADLPFTPAWLPLKPFLDAGYFQTTSLAQNQNTFLWNGGLGLEWLDGKIGVYVPLVGSKEIMDRLAENGGIGQRVGFRILFKELAPWKWLDEL